jgi:hypothetical protein
MAGGERIGLYELIALARECWVSRVVVLEEHDGVVREAADADHFRGRVRDVVDDVLQAAALGDFGTLQPTSGWRVIRDLSEQCPAWLDFCAVCDLAGRIDSLLGVLQGDGVVLARTCREDLDGLPVLADWCEDAGRPVAAAEVRHLHALVRHFRTALGMGPAPLVLWIDEDLSIMDLE